MKLELNHLKHYFGTGLKVIDEEMQEVFDACGCDFSENELLINDNIDGSVEHYCLNLLKPLLLPLSALTEPMEDGSVPIVELAKIASFIHNPNDGYVIETYWYSYGCKSGDYTFWYNGIGNFNCTKTTGDKVSTEIIQNQLQLFEYLFANHFDIYGLIDAGLAIDKRTLK